MSATILQITSAGKMTADTYREFREQIRTVYGDSNAEAKALRDQALAELYYRSGWTQEELATEEGVARQHVARRLLFGRFLAFAPDRCNLRSVAEFRFRSYWERTDKANGNERQRFTEVLRLMEAETRIGKPPIKHPVVGEAIVKRYADGKWHNEETIKAHIDAEPEVIDGVLRAMRERGTYSTHCERKKSGASWKYRIVRKSGTAIDLDVLRTELDPLIEGLEAEGRKNAATASPSTVANLASQLRQLLDRLGK